MKDSNSTNSAPQRWVSSMRQLFQGKRIAYLTLPLLIMATITEFVILATGWKYQQTVCLPQGMGVTFFGIGPIGATILAVELLKLPLAIWTASRTGWQKGFMLVIGLPLICVLTFQLVKDMAVYEMGTAMAPAAQFLEKAAAEETKISQLNAELKAIEAKRAERDHRLTDLAAKQAKTKTELEESLKRNEASRQDAITLTDYQKKELSEVETRQANITKQFNADTESVTKAIAELRARRETELARATTWNAEEARIENAYKAKLADYTNKKNTYLKEKAEYDDANFLKRKLMREPVDPGVPPEREVNKILKPTLVAELEEQIKAKEAELVTINNKRRELVAQVDADARRLRGEFDQRSTTKREESDKKREELAAALTALAKEEKAQRELIDQEFAAVVQKVDGLRSEIDESRKRAEGFYEAREAAIRKTQVHRIATTVEIVRGLIMGERPMSITASAKERGDILTDQISMVRIWVYPVLAFIVAFLPTLMVEIGFSTVFKPEQQRPAHRMGFLGRGLHQLYIRAGRQKILRAERLTKEASGQIAARDRALAAANTASESALAEKDAELQAARETINAAATEHEEELKRKENEWVAKFTDMADSLNRTVIEKDALRDLQKSEIERQIQMRQNAWSDRITQLRQELDDQRNAAEAERTTLMQENHEKLMQVTEECKAQVAQVRRQMADAELATLEATAKLSHDLKEALAARDTAESQLQHQADTFTSQVSQAKEQTAREVEKAVRQERHRLERRQLEFDKALRQRDEEFEHRLKQQEQELSLAFEARLEEEKAKVEQVAQRREVELERKAESRVNEVEARWKQEGQQREEAAQVRLKQREQQLQAQADVRVSDLQTQAEEELRRRESELERDFDAQLREAEGRFRQEVQQKELASLARLKQREQELATKAAGREAELQNQWAADLRAREEDWERQAQARVRGAEARLGHDAQQKEEIFQMKLRQREQQLQAQFDARQAELRAQWDQNLRGREEEWERNAEASLRAAEARWITETQQKEELLQSKSRQRDQQWQAKLEAARAEMLAQTEQALRRQEIESAEVRQRALREQETTLRQEMEEKNEVAQSETKKREQELVAQLNAQDESHKAAQSELETELEIMRGTIEPFKALLARTEKERDEARQSATEGERKVQDLEKKLMEASSLLTGWRTGKGSTGTRGGKEAFQVARSGLGTPVE